MKRRLLLLLFASVLHCLFIKTPPPLQNPQGKLVTNHTQEKLNELEVNQVPKTTEVIEVTEAPSVSNPNTQMLKSKLMKKSLNDRIQFIIANKDKKEFKEALNLTDANIERLTEIQSQRRKQDNLKQLYYSKHHPHLLMGVALILLAFTLLL